MRNAAYISAGMHVFVVSMIYFGLPTLFTPKTTRDVPVVVEIVDIGDVPARRKSKPAPPQEAKRPPAPKSLAPASKGAPPKPPPPPKLAPPSPSKAVPVPRPKAEKEPPPLPRRKPQMAAIDPAPEPKRKPEPPEDDFRNLLRNLSKEAEADRKKKPDTEPEKKSLLPKDLQNPDQPRRPMSIDEQRLIGTLAQMVISQITPCWSIPVGAKDAAQMQVGITILLNREGRLVGAPRIEDQARMARDPSFRAVAESALRALRNPQCTPLRLPIKNYETWRRISFNFDPREVMGQ